MKVSNAVYLGTASKILKPVTDPAALEADQRAREFVKEMLSVDPALLPAPKRSAEVVVGGRVIATIYQNRGVVVEDRYAGVTARIDKSRMTAEQVAREIARLVGGTVTIPRKSE